MRDSEAVMDRFRGSREDLGNAIKTTREVERLELMMRNKNRLMEDTKVFSKIVKNDGIAVAQSALTSNNMQRDIGGIGVYGDEGNCRQRRQALIRRCRSNSRNARVRVHRSDQPVAWLQVARVNATSIWTWFAGFCRGAHWAAVGDADFPEDWRGVSARGWKIKTLFDTLGAIQQSTDPGTMLQSEAGYN